MTMSCAHISVAVLYIHHVRVGYRFSRLLNFRVMFFLAAYQVHIYLVPFLLKYCLYYLPIVLGQFLYIHVVRKKMEPIVFPLL